MIARDMSQAPQRQIISRIPQRGMDAEQWGFVVENELVKIWTGAMSVTEREGFKEHGLRSVSHRSFAKLDDIILRQAETLGWRITLSELVRFRLSEWDHEQSGPEKFKTLGLAMRRFALIIQRRRKPPIEDPDQWAVKKETVEELRLVLERLRAAFAIRRSSPRPGEVHDLFSTTISDSPQSFPHLIANLERWQKFISVKPEELKTLLTRNRATPAGLYDEFLSWCTGWDPETLRQAISRLGGAKL